MYHSDERCDHDVGAVGAAALETAENIHRLRLDAHLLISFTQSRRQQMRVATIKTATRKGDLAAMAGEAVGTPRIKHMKFAAAPQEWHQHCRGLKFGARLRAFDRIGTPQPEPQPVQIDADVRKLCR